MSIEYKYTAKIGRIEIVAIKERNIGMSIGHFKYNQKWNWVCYNTEFKDLKIEDLAIDNLAYYTPPPPTYMGIEIPDKFLWVFPDNKFVLEGFEIPLQYGAVDVAYFQWQAFRDCLDNGNHEFLKRALLPLWDYVAEQVIKQNFIQL
jgi:hypothetical protein